MDQQSTRMTASAESPIPPLDANHLVRRAEGLHEERSALQEYARWLEEQQQTAGQLVAALDAAIGNLPSPLTQPMPTPRELGARAVPR